MAEGQLIHNQELQNIAIGGDIADMKEARRYGFIALLALIIGAIICAYLGLQILAGAFLGTGALGTVGVLVRGRGEKDKD